LVKAFQALESKLSPLLKAFTNSLHPLLSFNFSLVLYRICYLLGRSEARKSPIPILPRSPSIATNVRRYVALVPSRGGACFCTRGAV